MFSWRNSGNLDIYSIAFNANFLKDKVPSRAFFICKLAMIYKGQYKSENSFLGFFFFPFKFEIKRLMYLPLS